MIASRRQILRLTACATAGLLAASKTALALDYPTRPVHIVVGFPAGSAPDIVARHLAQRLTERLRQTFVIDNRPGAATLIGTETVVRAPADGYTLLLIPTGALISSVVNQKFNFARDIAGIASLGVTYLVMVINPSLPVKTMSEFIAYAKANPGKINLASPGNETAPHVFGELFKMKAAVDLVHVPYRGNYLTDLLSGQVQAAIPGIPSVIQYIKESKLRALAVVGSNRRSLALPDVPAMSELIRDYDASDWMGVGATHGTPAPVIAALHNAINAVISDPGEKNRFVALGLEPSTMTVAQFSKLIADDTKKWEKIVKVVGIRPA